MLDINQTIANLDALEKDPHGYLTGLEEWSESIAHKRAQQEGITLTNDHWEVIHLLRNHYRLHGPAPNARQLLNGLEERFEKKGSRKYLYQLFPGGPVSQGSKIAGLPPPPYSSDPSFGSVE